MSALASPSKFPPGRSFSSTGHSAPRGESRGERFRVHSAPASAPILKRRFQDAYNSWRAAGGAGREAFADEIGVKFSAVKRWLSEADHRPVPADAVETAEAIAHASRTGLSVEEIAQAIQDFARAEERLARIYGRLREAVA